MKILIFLFNYIIHSRAVIGKKEKQTETNDKHLRWRKKERKKEKKNKRRYQGFADAVDVESIGLVRLPDFVRAVEFDSIFEALVFDWSNQNFST